MTSEEISISLPTAVQLQQQRTITPTSASILVAFLLGVITMMIWRQRYYLDGAVR